MSTELRDVHSFAAVEYNGIWLRAYFILLFLLLVFVLSYEQGAISFILSASPLTRLAKYELAFFMAHQQFFRLVALLPFAAATANPYLLGWSSFVITLVFSVCWAKLQRRDWA